jgi:geranyl-CoA carboxylase alpha subunit
MKRLLIANRGEIARRIIRTAHAMGIDTVAVHSDPDVHALHVREAGTAFALGGARSADSYLRVDRLIEAAQATGADAVHPGYGFLSENADFAQAVMDAGLVWVGPPPAAIRALGSKAAAKALAAEHGVPCLPGYAGAAQDDNTFEAEAERIGFPLMVKAVAGGGGRGMRLVTDRAQLRAALASARSEALAGFGCADLLIERALLRPRHVEVQVLADANGHCIHLGERDCSVQRRHQKIIEEAPSPAVTAALRAELGRCAIALAQAAGYVGAGTVEFLLEDGRFHLMEMNTRLQVEHPVTEALTGLDLVAWQLRIARGEALTLQQDQVRLEGHAIEVRLCAEDAYHRPHAGTVVHFAAPALAPGLRFDHALESGSEVTPHYDPLLGKLIAHAPTRAEAIDRLDRALAQTQVLGLSTNRGFLSACLQHPVFRAGEALIPFLSDHADDLRSGLQAPLAPGQPATLAALLAVRYAEALPASELPAPFACGLRFGLEDGELAVALQEQGAGRVRLMQGERTHRAELSRHADGALRITLDGQVWLARAVLAPDGRWHAQVASGAAAFELWLQDRSHLPARQTDAAAQARELRAPFNGRLVALHVQAGDAVRSGAPLAVIESMKLEHTLAAGRDALIASVAVTAGQQVGPGQLLLTFAE